MEHRPFLIFGIICLLIRQIRSVSGAFAQGRTGKEAEETDDNKIFAATGNQREENAEAIARNWLTSSIIGAQTRQLALPKAPNPLRDQADYDEIDQYMNSYEKYAFSLPLKHVLDLQTSSSPQVVGIFFGLQLPSSL